MNFSPHIAARRFGYGLSPVVAAPTDPGDMLDGLGRPDPAELRFPLGDFRDIQTQHVLYERFRRHARKNAGTEAGEASYRKQRDLGLDVRHAYRRLYLQMQLRRIHTRNGFRERLVSFWADHFTAMGKQGVMRMGTPLYVEDAIRPHVAGTFADLLIASVTHPLMLHYLDQAFSVGPGSQAARHRPGGRGLNENLAREVLELHTLGVDGPYGQKDVRALAQLFTGLSRGRNFDFKFRPNFAEPGGQEFLGVRYGRKASLDRAETVLRDLAMHPATAAHLSRKLAVHFIADDPPGEVVAAMTQRYLETRGQLAAVYRAMLEHPRAWEAQGRNIRPPDEFVSSALRALGVSAERMEALTEKEINRLFLHPLRKMGQQWLKPSGPDGWAEEDRAWVTPQGMAGRLEWAMQVPRRLMRDLPDPRAMVNAALGPDAPPKVIFAASAAESRAEAIGLVLLSPAFQRR